MGEVVVIRPVGRLDAANAPDFDTAAGKALAGASCKVLVDLGSLEYISSAGLRCMLLLAKKVKSNSGSLMLCGLSGMVANVFEVSGFTPMFQIADDADKAVAVLAG